MKKCIYLAVLAASVLLAFHLSRETRRLRNQVLQLEEERRHAAVAAMDPGWVGVSEAEQERLTGIYRDIAQAYTNRDIMAMRIAMLKLPPVNDHLTWPFSPKIEAPLSGVFNDMFLRRTSLLDFDSPTQFREFIKANTEVALFFGGVYARRKSFDYAEYYETMTFMRLKQYKEKFAKEGKDELRDIAAKELEFWTAWVESPHGFTRQQARWEFRVCTEYVKILKPERAMTREEAAKHAYCLVKAMFKKTGYTPTWLSEYAAKNPTTP